MHWRRHLVFPHQGSTTSLESGAEFPLIRRCVLRGISAAMHGHGLICNRPITFALRRSPTPSALNVRFLRQRLSAPKCTHSATIVMFALDTVTVPGRISRDSHRDNFRSRESFARLIEDGTGQRLRPFGRLPVDVYDVGTVDQCALPSSYSSSIVVG